MLFRNTPSLQDTRTDELICKISTKLFKNHNDNLPFKIGTLLVYTFFICLGSYILVYTMYNIIHNPWIGKLLYLEYYHGAIWR